MKERPILFSAPMVRAILEGRKTQTRRVIKPQPEHGWLPETPPVLGRITSPHPKSGRFGLFLRRGAGTEFPETQVVPCPYGRPGDRLWVRETWLPDPEDDGTWGYTQWSGCKGSPLSDIPRRFQTPEHCIYRSTWDGHDLVWRPSIHMPRWASRITLEITDVHVERVQDISEADAVAEGVQHGDGKWHALGDGEAVLLDEFGRAPERYTRHNAPRYAFREAWEIINGPESWAANPWVWVIEFKKLEQQEQA